ncbi:hypothetical protein CJ739_1599 [Mariniflexile rhizosphaerae]|uniref:hypothetical protein n=1 Tax=unclassified Mariniflexile TaxID=2643887 RepID=UPI000CC3D682|nr:hypothetical protein [Mariniflexile sp. TRM1-10]AXP80686.1 hypothetical protein CJ739_1599 [Mariniflexile sp. TRM1-10]PLB17864.1 MAG: Fibronectin type III domain protein [Flavobacteriaceae bacterium FS1-H7996/R]
MKKGIFLLLLITTTAFSQITDENGTNANGAGGTTLTGNVGIGLTPSVSSPYKLEVAGAIKAKQTWFINTLPNGHVFNSNWDEGTALLRAGVDNTGGAMLGFWDVPQSNLTQKPFIWFHLEDRDDKARLRLHAYEGGSTQFTLFGKNQNEIFTVYDPGDEYTFFNFSKPKSYVVIGGVNVWPVQHKLTVKDGSSLFEGDVFSTGSVGIGVTSSNMPIGYKLAVAGNIITEEVKVKLQSAVWPDFVFNNNYHLPSLKEVEGHIKEKGHLKDIPSTKEVTENGILLGDMNAKLLQKIEELTLYTIEQEKKLESQDKANQELKERLLRLEQLVLNSNLVHDKN